MKDLMKKALIFSLMLTVALGTLVSCSDDDDKKEGTGSGLAAKVKGTYTGTFESSDYEGVIDVVISVASENEVLVTFAAATGVAPYKVKLVDTGVQGVIHHSGNPNVSFQTLVDGLIINDIVKIYTFTGELK